MTRKMKNSKRLNEYIRSLIASGRVGHQVVFHKKLTKKRPVWQDARRPWPPEIIRILQGIGISRLYRHQAQTIDLIRSGCHAVVSTPTASGKTLVYNLPVLENIFSDPESRALYIFPLKALAQDQLRAFETLAGHCRPTSPTAAIYDGDTTAYHRKRIRENPPHVLLTNPEMLHLAMLPHHDNWSRFFRGLNTVVVDEVHTYRGLHGSHMSQVFKRLIRICRFYGKQPTFVFSSATIANPANLASLLTGLEVKCVSQNGAPRGNRHLIFINPDGPPAQTAIMLLQAALHRELRTIVYSQSRKMTELIALWAREKSGPYADRISAYRAGFLPEERRNIEARLTEGSLLAVVSTSALELGIDIGDLDLCILVGYPGSVISTWQRSGRVGRSGQDSALVLIAGEDALDQYFMHNPEDFLRRGPEAAVINPYNQEILDRHLTCAAAEMPLSQNEAMLSNGTVSAAVSRLEKTGCLLRSADGDMLFSARKHPHRDVDLRGAGNTYNIISARTGESRGTVDGYRAFKETHPGAIYLHQGQTYRVDTLDLETNTVAVSKCRVDYYTRVRGVKDTEILSLDREKTCWGTSVCCGRLKVTDQVTGYEKWRIYAKKKLNIVPLDLPPLIFETEGIWIKLPSDIQAACEKAYMHFMGGIHAIEHAAIGIFPLLVMADRNDLGGISTVSHPQTRSSAIFIYDAVPGGAGLSRKAFEKAKALLDHTLKAIKTCPCETGCPSCVHSPKCGSGNRPIDKSAALFVLEGLKSKRRSVFEKTTIVSKTPLTTKQTAKKIAARHYGVFDLETQRSAQEVGGWHLAERMKVSCAVLFDSRENKFFEFLENQTQAFIEHLNRLDLIVGFNVKRFDYRVLGGYSSFNFNRLPTLDILEEIHTHLGYRLSLDHLSRVTLGTHKTADGLQALKWWQEGRIDEIIAYCRHDVEITKNLYLYGIRHGFLLFQNKAGSVVRVPVDW